MYTYRVRDEMYEIVTTYYPRNEIRFFDAAFAATIDGTASLVKK